MSEYKKPKRNQELTSGVRRSSGSYELVVSAVLLGLIGFGIDVWTNRLPLFTVVLGMVGFLGASISIFYRYREAMRQHNEERI